MEVGIMKVKCLFVFSTILLSMILVGCQQKRPYDPAEAIKNGDVVNDHGEIGNLDKFKQFIKNVNNGVKDKIRITSYTTEGDPIFDSLDYNGKEIKYTYDDSQDKYGGSGIKSATCSDLEKTNNENRVEYYLSKCSSDIGHTFIFRVPE
jgi:hypothetical protein